MDVGFFMKSKTDTSKFVKDAESRLASIIRSLHQYALKTSITWGTGRYLGYAVLLGRVEFRSK